MAMLPERINNPISTEELERRWAAVRAVMAERKIDVLLMQNNNDFMGGYVKYFTDVPATNGYPVTVIFPAVDRMTVIFQTKFGNDQQLPPEGDGLRRGVKSPTRRAVLLQRVLHPALRCGTGREPCNGRYGSFVKTEH
jgi:hypothetical protein